ncbi:hypothetical protein B0E53_01634 [Micromonospora sp. MH33]|nr:hypothetical protein B0E53_01634 [Micromonospora sp. MH33]
MVLYGRSRFGDEGFPLAEDGSLTVPDFGG